MCFAPQRRALFRHQLPKVVPAFLAFSLPNVLRAATACTFSTSQLLKVVRSYPKLRCFVHFDLEMCFAPQRRALFRHLNFQKWSEHGVLHFDLEMCFAPQRRALFPHLNFQSGPKLVCFVHFDFEMCFVPQRRALFHLSSGQMAPHPPL